jgi:hypothetical protein
MDKNKHIDLTKYGGLRMRFNVSTRVQTVVTTFF